MCAAAGRRMSDLKPTAGFQAGSAGQRAPETYPRTGLSATLALTGLTEQRTGAWTGHVMEDGKCNSHLFGCLAHDCSEQDTDRLFDSLNAFCCAIHHDEATKRRSSECVLERCTLALRPYTCQPAFALNLCSSLKAIHVTQSASEEACWALTRLMLSGWSWRGRRPVIQAHLPAGAGRNPHVRQCKFAELKGYRAPSTATGTEAL